MSFSELPSGAVLKRTVLPVYTICELHLQSPVLPGLPCVDLVILSIMCDIVWLPPANIHTVGSFMASFNRFIYLLPVPSPPLQSLAISHLFFVCFRFMITQGMHGSQRATCWSRFFLPPSLAQCLNSGHRVWWRVPPDEHLTASEVNILPPFYRFRESLSHSPRHILRIRDSAPTF